MSKTIALFSGLQEGRDPIYLQHAKQLGRELGQHHIDIIYGGEKSGLVAGVVDAALSNGSKVTGIVMEQLLHQQEQHTGLTSTQVVNDLCQKQEIIYERCNTAIVLPGGFGTMDEIFSAIHRTAYQEEKEEKIILLSTAGYYQFLWGHIQQMHSQGFLAEDPKEKFFLAETPDMVIDLLLTTNKN